MAFCWWSDITLGCILAKHLGFWKLSITEAGTRVCVNICYWYAVKFLINMGFKYQLSNNLVPLSVRNILPIGSVSQKVTKYMKNNHWRLNLNIMGEERELVALLSLSFW